MRSSDRVVLTLACLLLLPGCAHKKRVDPVRSAIQAAYDRQSAGYIAKDPVAVMAECSPAYTEINGNRIDSRSTVAEAVAGFLILADKIDATAAVRRVKVDGHIAEVIVDRHTDMLTVPSKKKTDPAPVQHRLIIDETDDDIWSDTTGRWLKLKSVALISRSTLDGKPEEN